MNRGRHTLDGTHLRIFDILRKGLEEDERPEAKELLIKLNQCGHPRPGTVRVYHCGSPSCPSCRDRRIRQERKRLQRRWSGVPARDLASFNLILGVTRLDQIDDIARIVREGKARLRYLCDRAKGADSAWRHIELALWVEMDCYTVDQLAALGSEKRRQIHELRPVAFDAEGTLWVVGVHGLIHLGSDLSADEVQIAISRRLFPAFNQIMINPLSDERSVSAQINDITNYAMKRRSEITGVGDLVRSWDDRNIREYAVWSDSFSRGFQSFCIQYGLKKGFVCSSVTSCDEDIEISEDDSIYITACDGAGGYEHMAGTPSDKYERMHTIEENMKSFRDFIEDPTPAIAEPVEREPTPSPVADPGTAVATPTPPPLVEERRPLTFRDVFEHEASPSRTWLSLRRNGRRMTFGDLFRQA